jgi:hypothetical protein
MSAVALLAWLSVAAPDVGAASQRSGLYGWGLGLELPVVGVMSGLAAKSRVGWGYTLGGAVAYELTPCILGRLYLGGGQSYGARAPIRYIPNVQTQPDQRDQKKVDARWNQLEVTLGGAYFFRSPDRAWAPFVGLDGGVRYGGYDFHFEPAVENLEATAVADPASQCVDTACRSKVHEAMGPGLEAAIRGGIRLDLASWLLAEPELQVVYTRAGRDVVSNTVVNRDVRGVREDVWLVRATFCVRVGL